VWHKQKFEREIDSGIIAPLESLPTDIVEQLHQAIGHSKTISDMDLRLIMPDDES